MTKEHYLQMKKQARVWFTVNIIISLIAIAGGILVVISKSRHIPFLLMALGALTLMNQVLVTPAFNAKKEAEEEHPEWKSLSTKDTKITAENLPTTDAGTEVINTYREIQSVPENSTEKGSSTVSNLTPKDVQTLQELKEEIESNAPSDSNSLDLNKAKDLAEKAQQQNWLKRGE